MLGFARLRSSGWAATFVGALLVAAPEPSSADNPMPASAAHTARTRAPALTSGRLKLLTYNIAGLPEGISRSKPRVNIPLMTPLLEQYDLVLVQEDFSFTSLLRKELVHLNRSPPSRPRGLFDLGDGLNRFSSLPFFEHQRYAWQTCHGHVSNGSDCLTAKGYSFARHELGKGAFVDIYNLHMDAGFGAADRQARSAQTEQLLAAIAKRSKGRAVIVAGDTNYRRGDEESFSRLLSEAQLADTCAHVSCTRRGSIDKVLYRSADDMKLVPLRWELDQRFVDAAGRSLSDHKAVGVEFEWMRPPVAAPETETAFTAR